MHMPLQIMVPVLEALRQAHALHKLYWARIWTQSHRKSALRDDLLLTWP